MLWGLVFGSCASTSRPHVQHIITPPDPRPESAHFWSWSCIDPTDYEHGSHTRDPGQAHIGPNPSCELALTSSQYHGTITVHETTCAHARTGNSSLNKGSNYGPTTEIHLSTRIIGCCISCREFTLRVRPCMIAGDGGLMVVC